MPPDDEQTSREQRDHRIAELMATMTREEKVAQVVGRWLTLDADRGEVAPYQGAFVAQADDSEALDAQLAHGLGQITRAFGSVPLAAADGIVMVNDLQRRLVEGTRPALAAIVHEECLTGLMALGATAFPCPLSWGSSWDPALVRDIGDAIRTSMRAVGAHQGLAPVLDVVRDARWGRVEECIAEDPYLVGMVGCAYIDGLQGDDLATGVAATAKHFAAYSSSEGGRNLAPAHIGPRELADVFLVPFEMAVKLAGVRSVMNAYQDNDGVPAAASRELLTGVLRDRWGFDGVVVADYFAVSFLHSLHGVAADKAEAGACAVAAGIDVELPNPDCYPLLADGPDLDRAVARVLRLKADLGLLDRPYTDTSSPVDLDPPAHRRLARRAAEQSVVLLKNDGVLPLTDVATVALVGPNADDAACLLGDYTFPVQVLTHHPDHGLGIEVPTIADGLRAALPDVDVIVERGCEVLGGDTSGFEAAVDAARRADVAVVVVGDRSGQFGAGTSGEGTDTDDLSLPGAQDALVRAVVGSGTSTVVVLVSGRPYAIGWITRHAAAVVAAWLPGEEGGAALASVLVGRVNPGGKTPVTFGRGAGQQPLFYNDKALGHTGYARSSTRPVFGFGHGLSYTTFAYDDLEVVPADVPVEGVAMVSCTVANTGARAGDEVVQLYVRDAVASVTRPVQELKGFQRLQLAPGERARVVFALSADMLSFTGVDLQRVVEPGVVDVMIGASSQDVRLRGEIRLVGDVRVVGEHRVLTTPVRVEPLST